MQGILHLAFVMGQASFAIRKPVFFVLNGSLLVLSAAVFFLYRDRKEMQQQNRELIIQNDSILSVNIVLADSVRYKPVPAVPQKSMLTKEGQDQ